MAFFKKGELALLWPFYLEVFVTSLLLFAPAFYVIYFIGLGLSIFQIALLMAVVPLTEILFEIPTGAVADVYGRKVSVITGVLIMAAAFLSMFFVTNYLGMLLLFALMGFGSTFMSGAEEAWVTEHIKNNKKDFLHSYFTKNHVLRNISVVVSGLIGAFLVARFGLSVIWIAGTAGLVISAFLLAIIPEHFKRVKPHIAESYKKVKTQAKSALTYSRRHNVIYYFIIAGGIFVLAGYLNSHLSWIPLLQNFGFPDYAFGYMWSAMGVVGAFAPIIGSKFAKKGKELRFMVISTILWILVSLAVIFAREVGVAFFILLGTILFYDMMRPTSRVLFHRFIPDRLRASVGSVEAMFVSLIAIIAGPVAGLAVDIIGPQMTIFASGIVAIPIAIIYYKIKDAKK